MLGETLRALVRQAQPQLSTWSLIVTIFGDIVAPRGGSIWLGTLNSILERLGIDEGVVRTALSRLAADGWVERERVGRNSFYRLTGTALAESIAAAERIYDVGLPVGTGRWCIVVLTSGTSDERAARRAELERLGFGRLASDILAAPERPAIADAIGPGDGMLRLWSQPYDAAENRRLAASAWPLEELARSYRTLSDKLAKLEALLANTAGEMDGLDALALRVWVVHELRRITLRDPRLPAEALPVDWPGTWTREQAGGLWHAALGPSENWLDRHGRQPSGDLPPPHAGLRRRFAP